MFFEQLGGNLIQGLVLGSVYGMATMGLSLIFGVLKVVNVGHGAFIMVGAFTAFWMFNTLGLNPLFAVPVAFALGLVLGLVFYRTHIKVDRGIALVPEGKHIFPGMTVYENLSMGAYRKRALARKEETLEQVYALFPRLKERRHQPAGSLSGGEQQMVTVGRALMTCPRLIMLDEPSQGLAPLLVRLMFETILKMKEQFGLTILLVEQNAEAALNSADYVYIMHEGRIKAEGPPEQFKGSSGIREAYLGI